MVNLFMLHHSYSLCNVLHLLAKARYKSVSIVDLMKRKYIKCNEIQFSWVMLGLWGFITMDVLVMTRKHLQMLMIVFNNLVSD